MAWAPDYVTLDEAREYRGISDVADDAQLSIAITAASRAIDRTANRQFGLVASVEDRFYTAVWHRRRGVFLVEIDDLMTETGFVLAYDSDEDLSFGTTAVSGDWRLLPTNAAAKGEPWTQIEIRHDASAQPPPTEGAVKVTARWGWTTVPTDIEQACLIQVGRLFERRQSPFGIAGSPEAGSELRLLERLDPDVGVIVKNKRRHWGAR